MLNTRRSLFLLASVACGLLAGPAAAAPHLFSLDVGKDGCTANVRILALPTKPRAMFTVAQCPTQVLIDTPGKRAITTGSGRVSAHAFDDRKVTELAPLPNAAAEVWLEEGDKLRARWLVTDEVEVKPGGARFEGKDFPLTGDDAAALPPWGTPAMAILAELDVTTGKPAWKRLEVKPTKTEAGDTPGLSVLSTPRALKKGVVSVTELAAKMTCIGGALDCEATSAAAKKLVGKDAKDADAIGTLAMGKGALVFAVMVGDTPHAFPPVLLCTDGAERCAKSVVIEKTGPDRRQLGLATQGGYAIVSEEYSSANATVFDAAGKVVLSLPSSTSVVFLPNGTL